MAQPQQNINISAPGFAGLNTQDAPIDMDISFASVADDCVIDKLGRIASRKGFKAYTMNPEILNDNPIRQINEFTAQDGTVYLFVCGNNTIFLQEIGGTQLLTALTLPSGYTITDDNWQIIDFNNVVYFVQKAHEPLKFVPATPTELVSWDELPEADNYPNAVTAAFGRLWTADFDNGVQKVYFSAFLDGDDYTSTSGNLELTQFWPMGSDEVTAMRAHNDFLIVFGKHSILVYHIPPVEGTMAVELMDTVEGIGCISRDSVSATGTDMYFLDSTGVRMLGRTIQEKSLPVGDVSANVRSDIKKSIATTENKRIKAVYHPEDSFYALFFPDINTTYVFDTRVMLQNGAHRPTRWVGTRIFCSGRSTESKTWFGGKGGIYQHTGYDDVVLDTRDDNNPVSYPIQMKYYTHPQTWGSPANLKFPKQVDITTMGSTYLRLNMYWSFDYTGTYNNSFVVREGIIPAQYGISEYRVGQYSGGNSSISTSVFNIWGQGKNVTFGFEATVAETQLSFQELNIQALMGRII